MRLPSITPGNTAQSGHSEFNWENGSVAFGCKEVRVKNKIKEVRRKNAPKKIIE